MNQPTADRELMQWLDALCSESITPAQLEKLQERLKADPAARRQYFAYVDVHVGLRRLTLAGGGVIPAGRAEETEHADTGPSRWKPLAALAAGILVFAALGLLFAAQRGGLWNPVVQQQPVPPAPSNIAPTPVSEVRLASAAGARFFGELTPAIAAPLPMRRDYVLMSGLVEVSFPTGATAILEGPAVFRILSRDSLGLDVGQCSVHAPPGAEGFRVETQLASVVDRGTRFSVKVSESAETEVHVVEGAADLYPAVNPKSDLNLPAAPVEPERINSQEARRMGDGRAQLIHETEFFPATYRRGLPDRVVSYEATQAPAGGVLELKSVVVQRGGKPRRYPVEDLIGVKVIGFCSAETPDRSGHLTDGGELTRAGLWDPLADRSLITGLINIGGSVQPLASDPLIPPAVFPGDPPRVAKGPNTPGLAIQFAAPVVNRAGPDVVLFEMQTVTNPADGDPFHVCPLKFTPALHAHTIRAFDITMTSSEAQKLAEFYLYRFDTPIRSFEEFMVAPRRQTPGRRNFRMLAVGIDLSQLGYAEGAAVDGLFLQDAADDDHKVDPVFIAGFPE